MYNYFIVMALMFFAIKSYLTLMETSLNFQLVFGKCKLVWKKPSTFSYKKDSIHIIRKNPYLENNSPNFDQMKILQKFIT